eukprot:5771144-Pyramimonas_sp.AAC.1
MGLLALCGAGFGSGRGGMGGGPRVDGGPRRPPMFASAVPVAPPSSGSHGGEMWNGPSAVPAQRGPRWVFSLLSNKKTCAQVGLLA